MRTHHTHTHTHHRHINTRSRTTITRTCRHTTCPKRTCTFMKHTCTTLPQCGIRTRTRTCPSCCRPNVYAKGHARTRNNQSYAHDSHTHMYLHQTQTNQPNSNRIHRAKIVNCSSGFTSSTSSHSVLLRLRLLFLTNVCISVDLK